MSAWLLSVMLATVPPGGSRSPKEARETAEQGKARYAAIAEAVARVSLDPKEKALFAGEHGRARTALLLLAVSYHESHWRRHIDLGLGPVSRRGRGKYHCMMQILVAKGRTPEGWTAADLVKSRDKCFRRGLHIMQRGQRYCTKHGHPSRAFLNHYASGYCDRGKKPVARRWRTFAELQKKHGLPKLKQRDKADKPSRKPPPSPTKPRKPPPRRDKPQARDRNKP